MRGEHTPRLHQRLEHQHARQDWERGKVILKILLGLRDQLKRDDPLGRAFEHAIHKGEVHGAAYRAGAAASRVWAKVLDWSSVAGPFGGLFLRVPFDVAMREISGEGVCVRVWEWSETSQTASILTRELGIVRVIAKGSKREKSDYSGGLEPATCGRFTALLKAGDGLSLLTSWDLAEIFPAVRRSLSAFHAALAMMDMVHHALHEQDPHPLVFDALLDGLRAMTGDPHADRCAMLTLASAVLLDTGHGPELGVDVRTGEPLGEARTLAFYPHLGGLSRDVGDDGVRDALHAATGHDGDRDAGLVWRVRSETVMLLRGVRERGHEAAIEGDPAAAERALRLLGSYFREVFQCDPPALGAALGLAGAS